MLVIVLIVSRCVPILLVASVALVAGRFLHDRWAERSPRLSRTVFAAVLVAAALSMGPYVLRSVALVRAELAVRAGAWAEADRLFQLHHDLGGQTGAQVRADWVRAALNQRRWTHAEALLLDGLERTEQGTVRTTPEIVLLLGICRYHQGRVPDAERTLRAVPDGPGQHHRDYFLGRLSEARGDAGAALLAYRASLVASPRFLPALYQLVRLSLQRGDAAFAGELLSRFLGTSPGQRDDAVVRALVAAVRSGAQVPPKEFFLVEH